MKHWLQKFLQSPGTHPILAGVAAGLYPVLFYYTNNYTLVDSWGHLGYFTLFFLLIPIASFVTIDRISKIKTFAKWQKYVLPFLNLFVFLFLLKICLYAGLQKKIALGILIISAIAAFYLHKHFKKWIIIQLLLAAVGLLTLMPTVISQLTYSKAWLKQPDNIETAVFKTKPNVYFLQPDGYVNFSELRKGYYNINTSEMESFLVANGFKNYPDFRNNYASTLSSNSATFMMKHHHYNNGSNFSEAINARDVIISENSVLSAFKNNGYKTHFISEKPYLLVNRPKMGFDMSNFDYADIAYINTGFDQKEDIFTPLSASIDLNPETPKFFFVEFFNPGHISNQKKNSLGKEGEKEEWLASLGRSNETIKKLVSLIKDKDPHALILIMADHGGYVGMDYAQETEIKTQDRDLIYSIFSSILSVHWPEGNAPDYDEKLKTSVNIFRILISYLSDDATYLNKLQSDSSFLIIKEGAPKGVYQYIDGEGNITFKKH
ncbi:sulfatase-like protein [Ulvibacter sp. MAR_2010_11]|uniref:sulfatase-like hydrolase/transferase n=1 Tax=Ulvibacter sp. MAR_2010_11 TaxID=1250229 RepID=UPI000C2C45C5|nr:sulfatase-like hydrolase/transferase [Ulvibacter sp. MAR_2010_11]PKA83618.1 sulfatase-like protein [Ulvibacter sp. MAR_2010_11]